MVLLLVAAALLTALVAGTTIWDTRPVGADELASARAQVQEQVDSPGFEKQLAGCRADPAQLFGPGATAADCARQLTPTADSYLSRSPLSLDEQRDQGGTALIVVLTALMILLGATFAGADWATGSMGNQLLFEPRRAKVWVAKAVAVTLACLVAAALLLVAFWLSLYLVAESRGIATGAMVQGQVRWLAARGVALAVMAGLGGYALTMLLRSTVATMALLFAYTVGGEVLLALAPVDRPDRWGAVRPALHARPAGLRGVPRRASGAGGRRLPPAVPATRRPLRGSA